MVQKLEEVEEQLAKPYAAAKLYFAPGITEKNGHLHVMTDDGVEIIFKPPRFDWQWARQAILRTEPKPPKKPAETAFGSEMIDDPADAEYRRSYVEWGEESTRKAFDYAIARYAEVEMPAKLPELEAERTLQEAFEIPALYDLNVPHERKIAYVRYLLRFDQVVSIRTWYSGVKLEEVEQAEDFTE